MPQPTQTGPPGATSGGSDGAASQAQDKAQEVAGQAKDKAQEAAGQAKGKVSQEVDRRSTQAGEQVKTQAQDVRTVGEELRKQGKEGPAKVADQAADRAEKLGDYLHRSSGDDILGDVEDYARSNPWVVALGGLAVGFAASRMVKASTDDRQTRRPQRTGGQLPQGAPRTTPDTAGVGTAGGYGGAPVVPQTPAVPLTPVVPSPGGVAR